MKAVLDTNVLVAGLNSSIGASHAILRLLLQKRFEPIISTSIFFEYEDVLLRKNMIKTLTPHEIHAFLDWFASVSTRTKIYFLWRPSLRDPKDDMFLETAVAGGANYIVTHNLKDYTTANNFQVRIISPAEFLSKFNSGGSQ
ncbi:MAG: putative toxin-antitoxin system toxin component, PIN family [Verrucomicrobia bacterium]|nr:putative toxin-antitoxin system toxin component, PIN family [Verrucomicrobiota bacterium]MCH8514474.1 putative toxin-antitoxin system toxin component, PIN family [Kiritimatiellia bacterium]